MSGSDPDATDDDVPYKPSARERFRAAPRRLKGDSDKGSLGSRLRDAMLKPVVAAESGTGAKPADAGPTTVSELEAAVARADDKERLVGLLLAPIAAAIGLVVTGSLIGDDPKAHLSNGAINTAHVNPSLYLELGAVTIGLALLMLAMAWFRKRLYLGITMALYGLSIFNLHFWGFGIPYILAGAWLLVRAFRLQSKLKEARGTDGGSTSGRSTTGRPGANKRYTPPTSPPKR